MRFRWSVPAVVGALMFALGGGARAESAARPVPSAEVAGTIWRTTPDGSRFRVRFDPGQRLIVGAGIGWWQAGDGQGSVAGGVLEAGLLLRCERPAQGWEVHWKRNHEIARLRFALGPDGAARAPSMDGTLYRGVFLRQSREGTLTLPTAPPVAISLPFDIGLGLELGRFGGPLASFLGLDGFTAGRAAAGVVQAEMLADFWRARRPGRWLAIGIGGRYDIALAPGPPGARVLDHRVAPLTALSLAARTERDDGLATAAIRIEAAHRFSSVRGWEQAFRADLHAEVIPLAVNDRPLAVFAHAAAAIAPDLVAPEVQVVVGVRFAQPL